MVRGVAPFVKNYETKAYLMYRRLLTTSNGIHSRDMVQYCVHNTIGYVDYNIIQKVVNDLKAREKNV
tara:strand:- start:106 stop:306 length:201 start_codon:yes stop_codon:yes gene_type:complete